MAYRLGRREELPSGLRRIAREQFDGAIASLAIPGDGRIDGVHDARKHFKKLRALLRLAAGEFDADELSTEDRTLRDAGRALADARDAEVMVAALDDLRRRFGDDIDPGAFSSIRRELMRERRAARRRLGANDATVEGVTAALEGARERVGSWPVERDSFGAVRSGLSRSYARARAHFRRLTRDPSPDDLHEFRKRIKVLWYHLRLLSSIWPRLVKRQAAKLERLAELLGMDHDLVVLRDVVVARGHCDSAVVDALVARRRAELWKRARSLAALGLAEKPKAFVARMSGYWKASRKHAGKRRR